MKSYLDEFRGAWVKDLSDKVLILENQIFYLGLSSSDGEYTSEEIKSAVDKLHGMLFNLIVSDYPMAKILDTSDLIIGAEGEGIELNGVPVSIVSSLMNQSKNEVNKIVKTINGSVKKRIPKRFEPELTGMAAGSVYFGLAAPKTAETGIFIGGEEIARDVKTAMDSIVLASNLVHNDISDFESQMMIDPALRDAALRAVGNLSPSSQSDIARLSIHGRVGGDLYKPVKLETKDRNRARQISDKPTSSSVTKSGNFIGSIREIDLDQRRFEVRSVEGLEDRQMIRCIYEESLESKIRSYLGHRVSVNGQYEVDSDNRPRLLYVESIFRESEPMPNLLDS
ncbi:MULTISPECIES: hypothetical protein [Deinococcus]|uniref:Uncharacterized protein n=1 Tax=Deinococcus rufus TaxID=2136097 RepID=A0ABV7ZA00_9DEIO|nr:hypothetical protein [Deinococcus sp. AB2017081]WQE95609.1 hypothetical protein U2P90_01650 [Deinococcus sp. AB2017081]